MIPAELRERKQWLVWRFEKDPKKEKPLKVPYYANGRWDEKRHGGQGTPRDRARLVSHDEAIVHAPAIGAGGIGLALLPGDGLIGVDLDAAFDVATDGGTGEVTRTAKKRTADIIKACASYTEYSPSGNGVHIICAGDTKALIPDRLTGKTGSFKNNAEGVEVFCGGQYFTFTGRQYDGTPNEIRAATREVMLRLFATVRGKRDKPKQQQSGGAAAGPADELRRVESALAYIDPDEYHQWIEIGHALKVGLAGAGFSVWDRWSSRSSKYQGDEMQKRWDSFDAGAAIKLGTLFKRAKDAGWAPPRTPKPPRTAVPGGGGNEPPDDGGRGDEPDDDGTQRRIRVNAGEIHLAVDEAEEALIESPDRFFQRSGHMVRIVRRRIRTVRKYQHDPTTLGFYPVEQPHLVETFTKAARWEKYNSRDKRWQRINCPDQVAAMYLARSGHWKLPLLWSVITAPTLRPDGSVLQKPGYDAATGTWYDPCGVNFPQIKDSPTKDDADRALELLRESFKTIPYVGKVDESVLLSLVLTSLVRRNLPTSPMGAISAVIMSSGKSLIADSISVIATGSPPAAMKFPETDEEAAKMALAMLAEGDAVLMLDNVDRPLQGDWLCTILTSETYKQRVLGRTEMMDVPTNTLILATGNHLVIAGDLRTRALLLRLDPKSEHPEKREFDYDLREHVSARRPELVAAGLTIMRAFIATGEIKHIRDHVAPWGRFERWTEFARAPLVWLGMPDPCESIRTLEGEDPERGELLRMLHAWHEVFDTRPVTAREAVERAGGPSTPEKELNEILSEVAKDRGGELNVKKAAKWLGRHVGRRVQGRQFLKADEKDHVALWKVEVLAAG